MIKVENFESYFKKQQADSNCGFAEEYEVCVLTGESFLANIFGGSKLAFLCSVCDVYWRGREEGTLVIDIIELHA